jgi:hypothetical protein
MPSIEKLRELGFVRGIPRWWKEKSAIVARPPTWMQRRLAGNEDAELAGEMPESRVFPDPSTFRTAKAEGRNLLREEVQQPHGILKRDSSPKQILSGRLTPPPAPIREPVRRASPMSDLLIDLEDTPAPPPSPQLSHSSAASAGSGETQLPSSRTSASPPPSPILIRSPPLLIDCKPPPKTVVTKNTPGSESSTQRPSQLSSASDTEDETPVPINTNTNTNTKLPRSNQQRRKPALRNTSRRPTPTPHTPTTPVKPQPGLAVSKHATTDNAAKSTVNCGRNAHRKVNAKSGGEVGAPELHAKIEQLRREAHQKDRARKGSVAAVSASGR